MGDYEPSFPSTSTLVFDHAKNREYRRIIDLLNQIAERLDSIEHGMEAIQNTLSES